MIAMGITWSGVLSAIGGVTAAAGMVTAIAVAIKESAAAKAVIEDSRKKEDPERG